MNRVRTQFWHSGKAGARAVGQFAELPYSFVAWERVLTVNDFWDGPRRGAAEVSGRPHIYESPFIATKDDFEEFFWVQPIDADLLPLVLEDWDIWNRWSEAFDRGEASRETHPAL